MDPVPTAPAPAAAGLKQSARDLLTTRAKEVYILIAILVVLVVVLAYQLYKAKEGFARSQGQSLMSNFLTGSNSPKGFKGELSGSISAPEGQYHPVADTDAYGTSGYSTGHAYKHMDKVLEHSDPHGDAGFRSLAMTDPGSVVDSHGKLTLGSSCAGGASKEAAAEQNAVSFLNGGESLGSGAMH